MSAISSIQKREPLSVTAQGVATVIAMLAGRVVRMLLCMVFFYILGNAKVAPLGIWRSVPQCLPGIVLQLSLIPLIVFRVENAGKEEE